MSEEAPKGSGSSMEGNGTGKQESDQNLGDILGEIERFSRISSELKDCISEITRKIINSLDALKSVRQAVARKKMRNNFV